MCHRMLTNAFNAMLTVWENITKSTETLPTFKNNSIIYEFGEKLPIIIQARPNRLHQYMIIATDTITPLFFFSKTDIGKFIQYFTS